MQKICTSDQETPLHRTRVKNRLKLQAVFAKLRGTQIASLSYSAEKNSLLLVTLFNKFVYVFSTSKLWPFICAHCLEDISAFSVETKAHLLDRLYLNKYNLLASQLGRISLFFHN